MDDVVLFKNARLITPEEDIERGFLLIHSGRIAELGPGEPSKPEGARVIDLSGYMILPGFIDIHVNGGGGGDFNSADLESFKGAARFHLSHGTTSYLASLISIPFDNILDAIETANKYPAVAGDGPLPELLGLYLEGPYINPRRRGAHPATYIRRPCLAEFFTLQRRGGDIIRLVTVAPEMPEALELIAGVRETGAIAALGHTDATYEEAKAGISAGITHVTHIFNAMRPFHHREPGPIGAILESEGLSIELIADGHHISPQVINLLYRLKGPDLILISDAASLAGMPEGSVSKLGHEEIRVDGGRVLNKEGVLAGSTLTLDEALKSFMRFTGAPLKEATKLITRHPARLLGLERKGRLAVGADADLVIMDGELQVRGVYVKGAPVHLVGG